jgi:hypothetical protein
MEKGSLVRFGQQDDQMSLDGMSRAGDPIDVVVLQKKGDGCGEKVKLHGRMKAAQMAY